MKKRTKLLSVLTAGVMAVGVMCYGFAQWSTEITAGGTVSANGKWDIKIVDASLELSNSGAAAQDVTVTKTVNSHDDLGIDYYNNSIKPKTEMNAKIAELKAQGATINYSNAEVKKIKASVSYKGEEGTVTEVVGYYDTTDEADEARNARSSELKADGVQVYSSRRDAVWSYSINYTGAVPAAEVGGAVYTDTKADYADVNFSLPNAWANYKLTVANEGSVNANLSDYTFDFTALDENVYEVSAPAFDKETLAPGEKCSFNIVVKVKDTDEELNADAASFSIVLNYAQDAVNEAPAAGHTHS